VKSKQQLDLSVDREVTRSFISDLEGLLSLVLADESLTEVGKFPYRYLSTVLLSKYVDEQTDSPELRRSRAIEKWLGVEQRNRCTNERLLTTDPNFLGIGYGWQILRTAARRIRSVLGAQPPEGLLSNGGFTGGATTSRRRSPSCLVSKFEGTLDATPDCWSRFSTEAAQIEGWNFYHPELNSPRLVKGNVLFTVPKTALIDRVACKEPDLNIYCQKAVGDFIRRRLKKRARIDLNDQSINRELALAGSKDGSLATIDLSSASDSLTINLVMAVLPREWFLLLDSLRSPKTFIDGASHTNEMFSSMGNGFTFELESMVFWALAQATCYHSKVFGRVSVYGDDIIVPSGVAPAFLNVLRWTGFVPNVSKTFVAGPFRESCGGHYHSGLDVTPFYLRRPFKDVSDLMLTLNQFRAWIIRTESDTIWGGFEVANAFVQLWQRYAALVPKFLWGGWSCESRVQLASLGRPQCELVSPTRRLSKLEVHHQTGMYLSCLRGIDGREVVLPTTPKDELTCNTAKLKVRRSTFRPAVFGLRTPLFWIEQLTALGLSKSY